MPFQDTDAPRMGQMMLRSAVKFAVPACHGLLEVLPICGTPGVDLDRQLGYQIMVGWVHAAMSMLTQKHSSFDVAKNLLDSLKDHCERDEAIGQSFAVAHCLYASALQAFHEAGEPNQNVWSAEVWNTFQTRRDSLTERMMQQLMNQAQQQQQQPFQ